jgi:hypothetical protein
MWPNYNSKENAIPNQRNNSAVPPHFLWKEVLDKKDIDTRINELCQLETSSTNKSSKHKQRRKSSMNGATKSDTLPAVRKQSWSLSKSTSTSIIPTTRSRVGSKEGFYFEQRQKLRQVATHPDFVKLSNKNDTFQEKRLRKTQSQTSLETTQKWKHTLRNYSSLDDSTTHGMKQNMRLGTGNTQKKNELKYHHYQRKNYNYIILNHQIGVLQEVLFVVEQHQ